MFVYVNGQLMSHSWVVDRGERKIGLTHLLICKSSPQLELCLLRVALDSGMRPAPLGQPYVHLLFWVHVTSLNRNLSSPLSLL